MSQFITKIPVSVDGLINLLPKKSDVHDVSLIAEENGQYHVAVIWGNDWLKTPFTFPVDYPTDLLMQDKLPDKTVSVLALAPEPEPHPPILPKKGVDKLGKVEHKQSK